MTESGRHELRVFVYGSLKRGECNHERYCAGFQTAQEAAMVGQLYRQTSGYPMLLIPSENILASGTSQRFEDETAAANFAAAGDELSVQIAGGDWEPIAGEILTFDEPPERLALLDALEDFRPGERSLYHRVLALAEHERREPVWVYVAPDGRLPVGCVRIGPRWP